MQDLELKHYSLNSQVVELYELVRTRPYIQLLASPTFNSRYARAANAVRANNEWRAQWSRKFKVGEVMEGQHHTGWIHYITTGKQPISNQR